MLWLSSSNHFPRRFASFEATRGPTTPGAFWYPLQNEAGHSRGSTGIGVWPSGQICRPDNINLAVIPEIIGAAVNCARSGCPRLTAIGCGVEGHHIECVRVVVVFLAEVHRQAAVFFIQKNRRVTPNGKDSIQRSAPTMNSRTGELIARSLNAISG